MKFIYKMIYIDFRVNICNLQRDIIIDKNIIESKTVKIRGCFYKAKHKMQIINLSFIVNHLVIIIM